MLDQKEAKCGESGEKLASQVLCDGQAAVAWHAMHTVAVSIQWAFFRINLAS